MQYSYNVHYTYYAYAISLIVNISYAIHYAAEHCEVFVYLTASYVSKKSRTTIQRQFVVVFNYSTQCDNAGLLYEEQSAVHLDLFWKNADD